MMQQNDQTNEQTKILVDYLLFVCSSILDSLYSLSRYCKVGLQNEIMHMAHTGVPGMNGFLLSFESRRAKRPSKKKRKKSNRIKQIDENESYVVGTRLKF